MNFLTRMVTALSDIVVLRLITSVGKSKKYTSSGPIIIMAFSDQAVSPVFSDCIKLIPNYFE